ncbi:hypothetical protein ACROYT_G020260 [Oculina patagonica]
MADLAEVFSCANCGCKQRFIKRCTACKQVFYCSKECQVSHWPHHKPSCQDLRNKDSERNVSSASTGHTNALPLKSSSLVDNSDLAEISNKQDIPHKCSNGSSINNSSANKAQCEKRVERTCDSNNISSAMEQICLSSAQESNETENVMKNETVTIVIKHNKVKQELAVLITDNGNSILQVISDSVRIPISKLKLIHKGKIATCDNIKDMVVDKALFLAFGEVSESEEGLEKTDIDLIIKQLDVERNVAVRVLRKTGNVLDAIIEIGNM